MHLYLLVSTSGAALAAAAVIFGLTLDRWDWRLGVFLHSCGGDDVDLIFDSYALNLLVLSFHFFLQIDRGRMRASWKFGPPICPSACAPAVFSPFPFPPFSLSSHNLHHLTHLIHNRPSFVRGDAASISHHRPFLGESDGGSDTCVVAKS